MVPPIYIWPSYASQMLRLINFLGIVLECLVDKPSSGKQIYPPTHLGRVLTCENIGLSFPNTVISRQYGSTL